MGPFAQLRFMRHFADLISLLKMEHIYNIDQNYNHVLSA